MKLVLIGENSDDCIKKPYYESPQARTYLMANRQRSMLHQQAGRTYEMEVCVGDVTYVLETGTKGLALELCSAGVEVQRALAELVDAETKAVSSIHIVNAQKPKGERKGVICSVNRSNLSRVHILLSPSG